MFIEQTVSRVKTVWALRGVHCQVREVFVCFGPKKTHRIVGICDKMKVKPRGLREFLET